MKQSFAYKFLRDADPLSKIPGSYYPALDSDAYTAVLPNMIEMEDETGRESFHTATEIKMQSSDRRLRLLNSIGTFGLNFLLVGTGTNPVTEELIETEIPVLIIDASDPSISVLDGLSENKKFASIRLDGFHVQDESNDYLFESVLGANSLRIGFPTIGGDDGNILFSAVSDGVTIDRGTERIGAIQQQGITTTKPAGGLSPGSPSWQLGTLLDSPTPIHASASQYVEVNIGGLLVKLAVVG